MPAHVNEGGPDRPTRARRTPTSPVEARLAERIDAFEDAARRTRACEEPEAIHDLRVASRRLIEFLRSWRDLLPEEGFRRIARELRAVRRRVGRARDLEVQVGLLRERLTRHGPPDEGARALLLDLESRLERRRRRAAKRVRSKRSKRLQALLSRSEQDMKRDLVSQLQAFEVAHGRERERRVAAIDGVRAALGAGDDAALHQARITVKKWRYAVESLGENEAPVVGITLDQLRELQEVLGAFLDRAGLLAMLTRCRDRREDLRASMTLSSIVDDLGSERREGWELFRALGGEFLRTNGQAAGGSTPPSPPLAAPRVSGGPPPP